MRKMFAKLRKLIVKGFMGFTFIVFALSACALDSDHWVSALTVCGMSFAILVMYAIANGAMEW